MITKPFADTLHKTTTRKLETTTDANVYQKKIMHTTKYKLQLNDNTFSVRKLLRSINLESSSQLSKFVSILIVSAFRSLRKQKFDSIQPATVFQTQPTNGCIATFV